MMFRRAMMLVLWVLISVVRMDAARAGCPHAELMQDDSYGVRAPARLAHGVLNVLSSPVQLFSEPRHTIQCVKPDLILGLGNGVIATGKYLVLGGWDVLTFWIPGDSGKTFAVTDCGWAQAGRDCTSVCSKNTATDPKK